jgi:hypothetical protein
MVSEGGCRALAARPLQMSDVWLCVSKAPGLRE